MSRVSLTVVGVLCVIFAIGVAAWKIATAPPDVDDGTTLEAADDDAPVKSKWFWGGGEAPERTAPPAEPSGWTLTVVQGGVPVVKAKVTVLESALLTGSTAVDSHPLVMCDDKRHLTTGAAALRAGASSATVLAEATSDLDGAVVFRERAWPPYVLVKVEAAELTSTSVVTPHTRSLELPARTATALVITNSQGEPLVNARATIVALSSGEVREASPNAEGRLELMAEPGSWAIVEADGYFPQPIALENAPDESPLVLQRDGVVEVVAPVGLGNFRVQLTKRHPRTAHVRDGKVSFEGERPGYVSVNVVEPGLLGSSDGTLLEGERLTINLQAKRAAKLFVTVVDEQGNPVPAVTASLTQPNDAVDSSGNEEGARIELGPVGEGPGVLQVSAPGFRTRSQSLELKAGETDLEVVLAEAPTVTGVVVDGAGKPVERASVQVFADVPNDLDGVVTGPDGRFKLHVDDEGSWTIEASDEDSNVARAVVKVPSGEISLRLEALSTAVITVVGPDGRPAPGVRVLLAGADSVEADSGESDEDGQVTFEALFPGHYRLEVDETDTEYLREAQELTVRSGDEAHATLHLRSAASIEAVLIDEEGAPVPYATIMTKDGAQSAETSEDGSFILTGFEPGQQIELAISHEDFVELAPSSLASGTKSGRLKALAGTAVTGRVIDEQHEPVQEFMINGVERYTEDGRFEARVDRAGLLTVSDFGGAVVEVKVEGRADVGDVVLVAVQPLTGVVLDDQRRPVGSARLTSNAFDLGEVTTDGDGHFEANLLPTKGPIEIDARSGELAAVAEVAPGAKGPIEIVLAGPTRVEGLVRGSGRSIVTTVVARGPDEQELQVDTDAQGRFSLTVTPGFWQFGTRSSRALSVFKISGREQRLELGAADGACEIAVAGTPMPSAVYLVPTGMAWAPGSQDDLAGFVDRPTAGVIELSVDGAAFVGRGVTCASYQVHAVYQGEVVSSSASLSSGVTQVVVRPKRLSSVGPSLGFRHTVYREVDPIPGEPLNERALNEALDRRSDPSQAPEQQAAE